MKIVSAILLLSFDTLAKGQQDCNTRGKNGCTGKRTACKGHHGKNLKCRTKKSDCKVRGTKKIGRWGCDEPQKCLPDTNNNKWSQCSVECSANEEKFFVYSIDPSMIYPFVASYDASLAPPSKTKDLVGNTSQGLQLSITQGSTIITQAGGKPLTVTSPNTLEGGGFNVVSEDFCLGDGIWTVRQGAFAWGPSTHTGMGAYNATAGDLTLEDRSAPGAPINTVPVKPQSIVDFVKETFYRDVNDVDNSPKCKSDPSVQGACSIYSPFEIRWGIFPAEIRADAEAAAANGFLGLSFMRDNFSKGLAIGEVDYETEKVFIVPEKL